MKTRHRAEQIEAKVRQADVDWGKGLKVPEVGKALGIREQTDRRASDFGMALLRTGSSRRDHCIRRRGRVRELRAGRWAASRRGRGDFTLTLPSPVSPRRVARGDKGEGTLLRPCFAKATQGYGGQAARRVPASAAELRPAAQIER